MPRVKIEEGATKDFLKAVKQYTGFSYISLAKLVGRHGWFFYIDKHYVKEKAYCNSAINFTNRSLPLLHFFKESLEQFGFHSTQKTKFSVFLRREKEVVRYFNEIGSSNPKHIKKLAAYFKNKYGEVPKWS